MAQRLPGMRHNAWLLDLGQGIRAAVGARVLVHIIDAPALHPVPCAPPHCHSVVSWEGRLLPVLDMAARLGGAAQTPRLLAVAAYQDEPEAPVRFGALVLGALPVAMEVGDVQPCPLPEQPAGWDRFACSCFEREGAAVPVLHLGRIFAQMDEAPCPVGG
jgi:chemotaxis signal transduction protein